MIFTRKWKGQPHRGWRCTVSGCDSKPATWAVVDAYGHRGGQAACEVHTEQLANDLIQRAPDRFGTSVKFVSDYDPDDPEPEEPQETEESEVQDTSEGLTIILFGYPTDQTTNMTMRICGFPGCTDHIGVPKAHYIKAVTLLALRQECDQDCIAIVCSKHKPFVACHQQAIIGIEGVEEDIVSHVDAHLCDYNVWDGDDYDETVTSTDSWDEDEDEESTPVDAEVKL